MKLGALDKIAARQKAGFEKPIQSFPGQSIVVPAENGTKAYTSLTNALTGEIYDLWLPVVAWQIKHGRAKWPITLPASSSIVYPAVEFPSGLIEDGTGDIFASREEWLSRKRKAEPLCKS
jgi:hypothetical protein